MDDWTLRYKESDAPIGNIKEEKLQQTTTICVFSEEHVGRSMRQLIAIELTKRQSIPIARSTVSSSSWITVK